MECFRQIVRFVKSPFQKSAAPRIIEIGPPTNFRKENMPAFFSDADTLTSHDSRGLMKDGEDQVSGSIERRPSTREKIKQHVRRMSIKINQVVPEIELA
ncbi:hypothetical protein ASPZODRAFT_127170 [Penicilliopsis zonata CBS 506.65]|uniref:Uncharacterized protein n=1 Tax=Penicilliopsis zonata CBS 506.65 TaxID=1073090 RepID=A0A1L9SVA4_9EURO|nr:hypothetical protein ASPZODRAFT_127170 [Penicilliopsis zonata CBS 506.65]OJJ51145.1 hypothetical protein ASPZODRAFT_127170 [Penicilliopsis zonata CBS 506.65]